MLLTSFSWRRQRCRLVLGRAALSALIEPALAASARFAEVTGLHMDGGGSAEEARPCDCIFSSALRDCAMQTRLYAQLCAIARRISGDASSGEDIVQEAMLAAVLAGRTDFGSPQTLRWLAGTIRNQVRMAARSGLRRRRRDGEWQNQTASQPHDEKDDLASFLAGLPPSLKSVAALALSGHNRREIAWLLNLSDTALRQRIMALKRKVVAAGLAAPPDLPLLNLDIAYGRIRDVLLPGLMRQGGFLASHDPDGHLFIVRRSQNPSPRQPGV